MKLTVTLSICLLFLLLLALPSGHADGRRGFHQKVYVVPAPGKVTIDGKLDDWDLSGQITISVTDETSAMQSARFAMMYDKDALYVSGVVRDPTPMLNRHDPLIEPSRGWDADACQIYLTTDGGYPVNKSGNIVVPGTMDMHLWYFTDRKEPALAAFQGLTWAPLHPEWNAQGAIPSDKFQAAYVKAADGKGYTFEYRIPWDVLGATKPLKGGDLVAGLVQFDWSDASGMHTNGGGAWAYDVMSRPGFPWQDSGCWGKVIFSDKGHLSPELVEEGLPPAKPLPLTFEYDLPADGDTTIQLFDQNGTLARTIAAAAPRKAGHNVESWDGLDALGLPLKPGKYVWKGLYHDPITTKFLFSAHNSGQPPYHTNDGTGSWGGDHGNPTTVCATDDGLLMTWQVSEAGYGIIKTDFNGKKIWGGRHNASDIATDGKRLFVVGDFGYDGGNLPKVFDGSDCRPLNWGTGKLTLDPPANTAPEDQIATAIAYSGGKIYVCWPRRNAITVYNATRGSLLDTIDVPDPSHVALESDGTILAISQGKILAVSGHSSRLFTDTHVDLVGHTDVSVGTITEVHNGIAVGPDGDVYVSNNGAMQDISVFDSHGAFLRTIGKPGGRPAMGAYDRNGIYEPGGLTVDKLGHLWVAETTDYPKRISEWDVKTRGFVNEFFGASSYFGWAYIDPRHPDELYCHNVIWKVDWNANTCTPVSTIWRPSKPNQIVNYNPAGYNGQMRVYTLKDGSQAAAGYTNFQMILSKRVGDLFLPYAARVRLATSGIYSVGPEYDIMKDAKKYPDGTYYWVDSNNDQTIQENELTADSAKFDEALKDLNAQMSTPSDIEAQGIGLGASANLTRWDTSPSSKPGTKLWAYQGGVDWGNAINLPPIHPGDMIGFTIPLGVAGGFTGAASYFGMFQIVTTDGVYVGQGFRDQRLGGGVGQDTLCSETIVGELVKPDGMNRTFFLGGAADGRVTEVLGLDTVKRLPGGEYDFTEADADKSAAAMALYSAKLAKSRHLSIARGLPLINTAKTVGKSITPQRSFTARAAYDATNLYIQYNVISESELTNSISDPHLLFKGGNLMDIQIATNSTADPARKTAGVGDVRILVTRQAGKTVAIMYRPKVAGFKGQPIILKSPANQQAFDSIEPVDVGLDYQSAPNSFTAVVTIPLKLLGMAIKPGQVIKMDIGYIFGDPDGNRTSAREYWSNNGFAANVTNDVPNESLLEPQQWGTAVAE